MIDKYYEKLYNSIENEIKSVFIPSSIVKDTPVKILCKARSKEFSLGERKNCVNIGCNMCPFDNRLGRGCLPSIIKNLLRKNSSITFEDANFIAWIKAGEYFLKHYFIEYKQEEMDV